MKRIYSSSNELIGNTPLVELVNIERELKIKAHIIAKPEFFNPGGSAKDRVARAMIGDAETKAQRADRTIGQLAGSILVAYEHPSADALFFCPGASRTWRTWVRAPSSIIKPSAAASLLISTRAQIAPRRLSISRAKGEA